MKKGRFLLWLFLTLSAIPGCFLDSGKLSLNSADPASRPNQGNCAPPSGNPWTPQIPEEDRAGDDPASRVVVSSFVRDLPGTGTNEIPKETEIEIPMPEDLGPRGSLMLVAESLGLSSSLSGGAYPILTSLNDGSTELINLASDPAAPEQPEGCSDPGLFCCKMGRCKTNPRWKISYPSAFQNRSQWEQHQLNPFGYLSATTFPTCRWSEGSPPCLFDDPKYFPTPNLRFGAPYRARYALILEGYPQAPQGASGSVRFTVLRKVSPGRTRGAMVLNLILVGNKNVAASHTPKGQQNMNALVSHILSRYSDPKQGVGISSIRAFEWDCRNGGEAFAEISVDQLGTLFSTGSSLLPPETQNQALNLFIVSNILGAESGFTILGASGAIGGPLLRGTQASGLAFASFNRLDRYNPACTGTECPVALQERHFVEMGETIAHEMGHFLGLNHLSESGGVRHDALPDTPECRTTEPLPQGNFITQRSCRELDTETRYPPTGRNCLEACPVYDGKTQFCPEAVECQFNHLMWWTGKNFNGGSGDGSLISEDSWNVIRFSPAVQ